MAVQLDASGKDEIKTHFVTREGVYKNFTASEDFTRQRVQTYQTSQTSPQVRVSLVQLPSSSAAGLHQQQQQHLASTVTGPSSSTAAAVAATTTTSGGSGTNNNTSGSGPDGGSMGGDRICFNIGKELYVYSFKGIRKATDLSKPIDKKMYKGTNPSCHDFNTSTATPDGAPLLVGFTTGQIQLVHPGRREQGKLYNEERLIDKTKVTCLKWIPGSPNLFLAAHASGHMYLYNEELTSTPIAPSYQPFKNGDGYSVMICKSKSARNPLYKWTFGIENYAINEICFSPCGTNLAIVSQDGFLRVFQYASMELVGLARSYFGGFLCVCWSPDGKYIVVGGEDDLITIYSFVERRVVARGQGHRSWVSVVAFDPYTTSYSTWDGPDFSDDETTGNDAAANFRCFDVHPKESIVNERRQRSTASTRDSVGPDKLATCYRLGSVGQDTQLCLWDITDDILRQSFGHRTRLSSYEPMMKMTNGGDGETVVLKPVVSTTSTTIDQTDDASAKTPVIAAKFLNCTNSDSGDTTMATTAEAPMSDSKKLCSTNSTISKTTNSSLVSNCISTIGNSVSPAATPGGKESTPPPAMAPPPSLDSKASSKSDHNHHSSAFNTLTQKLSNFSFSNSDKTSVGGTGGGSSKAHTSKKRNFTLSKTSGTNHANSIFHQNGNSGGGGAGSETSSQPSMNSLTKKSVSWTMSYDPTKLIGTPACPRLDECPVLEPMVCKKIAHERLTALIFREDCFIAACQDGFIYTWARPGYGYPNLQHNLPASPSAPPGGTVV